MTESQRRTVPRADGGELDTATAFLAFARESLVKKIDGLDDEQVRRVLVPTGTNLLGLVQHMAVGERFWFGYHMAGTGPDDANWDFGMDVPTQRSKADVLDDYRRAIADSDAIIASVGDLGARAARTVDGEYLSLRWVIAHVTSETVRHAGHADILRELIDGVTGR